MNRRVKVFFEIYIFIQVMKSKKIESHLESNSRHLKKYCSLNKTYLKDDPYDALVRGLLDYF